MESIEEQHQGIVSGALAAIEEKRYDDAAGWLRTPLTPPDEMDPPPVHLAGAGAGIYPAIIEAMRAVTPVAKKGHYDEHGTKYDYRRADDVIAAAHPALAEAGVFPVPLVREVARNWGAFKSGSPRMEISLKITYRFTAGDGSYVDVDLEVDNWNASDKGIGAAMTVALRIALLQLLVIPTGDPDPDAGYPEAGTAPALTQALAGWLQVGIANAPLDQLEGLWKLLTAHVPDSARVSAEDTRVWWEVFAARFTAEVEARRSKDDLAALWKALGPFGLGFGVGNGRQVADLITERNKTLLAEHRAAMEECRDVILEAEDAVGLDHAREVVRVHLTNHRISSADSMLFAEMLAKRSDEIRDRESNAAREAMGDPEENHDGEPADADAPELPTYEGR